MIQLAYNKQQGFLIVTVVVILAVLASIAMLLSTSTGMDNAVHSTHAEKSELDYVTEAGIQHALWQARQANCSTYASLTNQPFGDHSYSFTVTPTEGSPVTFESTAALASGATRTVQRPATTVYSAASIQTVVLQPGSEGEDAEIWDQQPNNNYANGANTWVSSATNDTTRTLLRFDLGAIPAGAIILEASLSLTRQSGSGSDQPVSAHRIRNSWSEDVVSWNLRETGTSWDVTGSDFDLNPITTTPVGPVNGRYEWNIAPLVQGWADGIYPNYGVVLAAAIAGMPGERFYTSDETILARRPSLNVSYACECDLIAAPPVSVILKPAAEGKDTFIEGESGKTNINNGSLDELKTSSLTGKEYRTLLQFDLSGVPANAIIQSAVVDLLLHSTGSNDVVEAHRLLRDWTENGSTWITYDGINPWTTPGGDYDAKIEDSFTTDSTGPKSLNITAAAQAWVNGSQANNGIILLSPTSPVGIENKYFSSDKSISTVPKLTINYTCPCGVCNAGSGGTGGDRLLFVVLNDGSVTTEEAAHQALVESWGYTVQLIDDGASQTEFDSALMNNDVVYTTNDISSGALNIKLVNTTIGVVTSEDNLSDEFGMASGIGWESGTVVAINDNTHYITSPFATGPLTVFSGSESLAYVTGTLSPDLGQLASSASGYAIVTLDVGAAMYGGGTAAGRRVQLPWGGSPSLAPGDLTADGLTILQRAIEWAAGAGAETGPIAHWKLDETTGTTAVDSVGGNDGTLINSPVWVGGKLNGGLSFDGSNDYIDVSSMNPIAYDDFTVVAWYKSADLNASDDEYIFEHNENWVDEITFGPTDDGAADRLRFGFSSGGAATWDPHYGTSDIVDKKWHHLVGVRSSGRIKLYVDGVEETDEVDAHAGVTINIDGDGPFIGDLPGNTEQVHGTLDDVRLYDRALTATEISELFIDTGGGGGGGGGPPGVLGFDTAYGSTQTNVRRLQIATQVTLPADGTVTSITAYVGGRDRNVRYAIYSDVAGEPGALQVESENILTANGMSWISGDVPATALSAGTYWLALSFDDNLQKYTYQNGGQTRYSNHRATQSGFTSNWGPTTTSYPREISIYATYTP